LDTPAGARDFQRFLIGKLRDIRAVVMNASLDDTSKSALMAAWTSLYDASKGGPADARAVAAVAKAEPTGGAAPAADAGSDPLLGSLLADDPGLLGEEPGPEPAGTATTPASLPNLGAVPLPGGSAMPGSLAGWGAPGGLPLSGRQDGGEPALAGLDDKGLLEDETPGADEKAADDVDPDTERDESADGAQPPSGPTTVTLPDGETVTASSPQLAAAIKAAAGGAPIADAFGQQGISIPAPGTAVSNPIDPMQVIPGDIGMFTDRHALALGHGKALLDGQIQHIATVSGPSFLGWEHPPAGAAGTAPARTDVPTPTRPAGASATER
jgi:hypothetical protein